MYRRWDAGLGRGHMFARWVRPDYGWVLHWDYRHSGMQCGIDGHVIALPGPCVSPETVRAEGMLTWEHDIAGIRFRTQSDARVRSFELDCFRAFLSEPAEGDVRHFLYSVRPDEIDGPPLPADLERRLRNCATLTHLGPGMQVFAPFDKGSVPAALAPFYRCGPGPADVPLVRAPRVRKRLEAVAETPENVLLVRHALSVEIMDHARNEAFVFFAEGAAETWWNHPQLHVVYDGLRRLFGTFMPGLSAFPLHSACVMRHGRAVLFVAPDGGGKTTAASLAKGCPIMSDDRNVLRRHADGLRVHNTPWGRLCGVQMNAPIGAIFLLEKSTRFDLEPLSPRDLMCFLWLDNPDIGMRLPVGLRKRAFDCLAAMIRESPTYRMRFSKDYIDWDAVDAAMGVN